jgi:hypothetical protein
MTSTGPYRTISRIQKPRDSGSDNPGHPENEGLDDPKASDANNLKDDVSDNSAQSVGTDASDDSRHTMARSRPNRTPKAPADPAAEEAAEEQLKQDEAVKWYTDVLGFPEPSATALYIDQTLTDVEVLSNLSDKSIDAICNAVCIPGGDNKGGLTPVLAIERLKLAVFCIKLYERTSCNLPEWFEIDRFKIAAVEDQQRIEDDYLSSKAPGPELKPMSLDVHSVPTCFDKVRIILNAMRGCTGIPLTYVIRLHLIPKSWKREFCFGRVGSKFGSIDEELVVRAPIIVHIASDRTDEQLEVDRPFTSTFSTDMKKVYLVLYSLFGATSAWQHVKKYQQAQAGRKTWQVLHAHFFGGDKATSLFQQTLKRLSDLKYDGNSNPNTWSFDKYTTAHVSAHNILHSLHVDYDIEALAESTKI